MGGKRAPQALALEETTDPGTDTGGDEESGTHVVATGETGAAVAVGPKAKRVDPSRREAPVRLDRVEPRRGSESPVRFVPTHRQPPKFEDELPSRTLHPLRRSLPRQFTDWRAKYLVEDDPTETWRECRVLDISTAGAGLLLTGTTLDEIEGKEVIFTVQLKGQVRNSRPVRDGNVRAGLQFVELTDRERSYIDSLEILHVRW